MLYFFGTNTDHKSKMSNPYDYDPITLFDGEGITTGSVYTDRLLQWDYAKHNLLCKKYFGDEGQYWDNRAPEKIEAFLRDWMDDQTLVLTSVVEYCNVSNGYPVWCLGYNKNS